MQQKYIILFITIVILLGQAVYGDASARIKRSQAAIKEFKATHFCPTTGLPKGKCQGFVIDHIVPLDCGGADDPSNMQWQTVTEGKAKDKWERNGPTCLHRTYGEINDTDQDQ